MEIARSFENFDLRLLVNLEPFTIFKLRSKRYAPVVAKLREQQVITSKVVQDLIKELLPKQSRKKLDEALSGWKQSRSGGTRYYNVILHDQNTGLSIQRQAEAEGILPQKVIAEAVALRSQHKSSPVQLNEYYAAQLEELHSVMEHAHSLDAQNRKLEHELQKRDRQIADLEAKLAERVAASSVEPEDEVAIASRKLNEYVENQAARIASKETTEATDYCQLEDEVLEDAQNLETESQVFQEEDCVEIVSSRQGAEFVWQIGVVKVANTVGCVVEVLGKTLWFCLDELVLVLTHKGSQP